MKNFFKRIKSSFYDPAIYEQVRTGPLSPTVKLLGILGVIGILVSMLSLVPAVISFAQSKLPEALEASYPDDLIISIKDGAMSINQPQPYYIKNTLPILGALGAPNTLQYLAIFDGADKLSPDLAQNSTFILVKSKYIITPGQNHQQQIIPFTKMSTSTVQIQKSTVVGIIDKIKPYFIPSILGTGVILLILAPLFGTLFWVIFHMLYILFPALIIFLFTLFFYRPRFIFKESYALALYASIPVAILFFICQMIFKIPPQYVYTILLLLVAGVNIFKSSKENK